MTNEELEGRSIGTDEAYTPESNAPQQGAGRSIGSDAAYVPESQKGPQFAEGFTPVLSQTEYIDKLQRSGYTGRQISTMMGDVGFEQESVNAELMSKYERERKAYLEREKKMKEERERLESEREQRMEAFGAEKKNEKSTEFESFDSRLRSRTQDANDVMQDLINFRDREKLEGQAIEGREEEFEKLVRPGLDYFSDKENPESPTAMPDQMRQAMEDGDYSKFETLFQSYENDLEAFDVLEASQINDMMLDGINEDNLEKVKKASEKLRELGYDVIDFGKDGKIDELDVEYYKKNFQSKILDQKSKIIEDRNMINESLGLPGSFNPQSDVDFNQILSETYDRHLVNFDNSAAGRYMKELDRATNPEGTRITRFNYKSKIGNADIMDAPYGIGMVSRLAASGFMGIAGSAEGLATGVVGLGRLAMDVATGGESETAEGLGRVVDIYEQVTATDKENAGLARSLGGGELSQEIKDMGFFEMWEQKLFNSDDVKFGYDELLGKTMSETADFIGGSMFWAKILGPVFQYSSRARGLAQSVDKGSGVLTRGAASAAKRADAIYRRAKMLENATLATTLGTSGAGGFYNSIAKDPSLSMSEKATMSLIAGTAEAYLGKLFSGFDKALAGGNKAAAKKTLDALKKESAERLGQMTARRSLARSFAPGVKDAGGEFLEEFGVELINQAMPILDAKIMGREPGELNWYQLVDAGLAGFIGSAPTSVMGGIASFQAHNKFLKRRKSLTKAMEQVEFELSQERDPDARKRLQDVQTRITSELMQVDDASKRAFDKMSDGKKRQLHKIHRDMAYTEAKLADPDLTTEEKEQLEKRYENLFSAKQKLEDTAEDPDMSEYDIEVPSVDATGQTSDMRSQNVTKQDKQAIESAKPSELEAPQDQQQEAVQLSLFDETSETATQEATEEAARKGDDVKARDAFIDASAQEQKTEEKAQPKEQKRKAVDDSDFSDFKITEDGSIDITDPNISVLGLDAAMQANRLMRSQGAKLGKAGYKVRVAKTREAYDAIAAEDSYGFVDHANKTIVLPPDANAREVREEFGHAALYHIIGKDAKSRTEIYLALKEIAKTNPAVAEAIASIENNKFYQKQGKAAVEEEAIMEVLLSYVDDPASFKGGGFVQKMTKVINRVLSRALGKDTYIEANEKAFLEFAEKFARATRGERVDFTAPQMQAAPSDQSAAIQEEAQLQEAVKTQDEVQQEAKEDQDTQEEVQEEVQQEAEQKALPEAQDAEAEAQKELDKDVKARLRVEEAAEATGTLDVEGQHRAKQRKFAEKHPETYARHKELTDQQKEQIRPYIKNLLSAISGASDVEGNRNERIRSRIGFLIKLAKRKKRSNSLTDALNEQQTRLMKRNMSNEFAFRDDTRILFEWMANHPLDFVDSTQVILDNDLETHLIQKSMDTLIYHMGAVEVADFYAFDRLVPAELIRFIGQEATKWYEQNTAKPNISGEIDRIRRDIKMSQQDKDSMIKGLIEDMLAQEEGTSTPETDALNRTEELDERRFAYGKRKQEFNYLKDTEIFYSEDAYVNVGEGAVAERQASKKIKVNDFFHFRNWYNYMTANGQRPGRITKMFYIKDGQKYTVKPPKPKTDRQGNVVQMEGAPHGKIANSRKYYDRQGSKARENNDFIGEMNDFSYMVRKDLKRAGIKASAESFIPGLLDHEAMEAMTPAEREMYLGKVSLDFSSKPIEQRREALEVARKNYQALRESGLTPGELDQMKPDDIFNMSGLTPHHEAKGGDATNDGGIRYSGGKRKTARTVEARRSLLQKSERRGAKLLRNLADFAGARGINFGYDRTGEQIGTGILEQISQRTPEGEFIASSHRNEGMSRVILGKFRREALEDLASADPKGFVLFTFSVLDMESMAGNPAIFADVVKTFVGGNKVTAENFKAVQEALNEIFADTGAGASKNIRDITNTEAFRSVRSLARKANSNDAIKIDTIEEAQAVLDVLLNQQDSSFKQTFENRNKFARRLISKFVPADKSVNDYLQTVYGEKQFKDVEGGTIIGAIKVPYTLEGVTKAQAKAALKDLKSGKRNKKTTAALKAVQGLDQVRIGKGEAFGWGLAIPKKEGETQEEYDARVEPMSMLEEQIGIADAYGEATRGADADFTAKFMDKEDFMRDNPGATDQDYENYLQEQESFYAAKGVTGRITVDPDDTTTDHGDNGERYSVNKRGQRFAPAPETGFQKWKNKWIRRLQNKYIDIFNLQDQIDSQKGIKSSQDFRMAEELMYGKAAEDLAKLDRKIEEITKAMKASGVKVDQLSDYLYALHAKERNNLIELRSNGKIKDGSGMTNAEADQIIARANKAAMDPIVKKIREIQKDTRETMVKFGLETRQTVDAFENMFDNYVPLAGLSSDELTGSPYPTGGAGMNVFGSTTKRAEGRASRADNILAQIVAQNSSVHIKARTNEALQKLHNLVKDNPNPKVWNIIDPSRVANPNDSRLVAVRIGGKQKFIYFTDPSYAESLRGMNLPQTNAFIRALRVPAQWLRASFTTLNPEFFISNFSRDIQAAVFNAAAEADIEGGMLNSKQTIARMMKLVPQTLKTLVKNSVQKGGDPAIEKYFQEFKEDGGKTGWAYAKPLDQLASELEGAAEGKTRTQEILGKAKNFAETIEGVNDAFENSIRLASYIAARENGVSREKAAQLAKNITVNFNKQGEWGPALNAVYLFFNASIQGTARLGRSLLNLKPETRPDGTKRGAVERVTAAQWMAGGLTLFSAMLAQLGYAMSDEDEDGIPFWDKIPDYVKERNLIIMRPNGKDYFKIPMPYGFNVFANMGTAMVEGAHGGKDPDEAMMFLFNSFMASFSPVSFGQSKDLFTAVGKGAVPTVMKPWVEVMTNETYFGGPVTGQNLPFGVQKPESELSFRSPEMVKEFFQWMNEATGGSEYKSGGLDFNPDKIWYMFEYYVGSAGKFAGRTIEVPRKIGAKFFSGEDIKVEANEIPMARILYGEPSKYFDYELYDKNKQEIKEYVKEIKGGMEYDKTGRHKGITSSLNSYLNKIDKQLQKLRKLKREASELPYAQRTARIQELRNKERKLIMEFNRRYEQARN